MQFSLVLLFPTLIAAAPAALHHTVALHRNIGHSANVSSNNVNTNSCSTGAIQCCNSIQNMDFNSVTDALDRNDVDYDADDVSRYYAPQPQRGGRQRDPRGLLDAVVKLAVGNTCSPINDLALGDNSCTGQTVCCSGNNFNGVVALGCTPINVSL